MKEQYVEKTKKEDVVEMEGGIDRERDRDRGSGGN